MCERFREPIVRGDPVGGTTSPCPVSTASNKGDSTACGTLPGAATSSGTLSGACTSPQTAPNRLPDGAMLNAWLDRGIQVYNVFYALHPLATRLEPLLVSEAFARIASVQISRYIPNLFQRLPLSAHFAAATLDDFESIGFRYFILTLCPPPLHMQQARGWFTEIGRASSHIKCCYSPPPVQEVTALQPS